MRKPDGYDQAQAKTGDFNALPPGGYVCVIKKAVEQTTSTGKNAILLLVDIAEGEHKDYFQKMFDGSTAKEKKWPNGGRVLQLTEGNSMEYFKGMITCIEKSNSGFVFDFDEKKLAGKKIGCIFGREQYAKSDGSLAFATKVFFTRSVDKVVGVEPPADRLLQGKNQSANTGYNANSGYGMGEEIVFDPNDLPF